MSSAVTPPYFPEQLTLTVPRWPRGNQNYLKIFIYHFFQWFWCIDPLIFVFLTLRPALTEEHILLNACSIYRLRPQWIEPNVILMLYWCLKNHSASVNSVTRTVTRQLLRGSLFCSWPVCGWEQMKRILSHWESIKVHIFHQVPPLCELTQSLSWWTAGWLASICSKSLLQWVTTLIHEKLLFLFFFSLSLPPSRFGRMLPLVILHHFSPPSNNPISVPWVGWIPASRAPCKTSHVTKHGLIRNPTWQEVFLFFGNAHLFTDAEALQCLGRVHVGQKGTDQTQIHKRFPVWIDDMKCSNTAAADNINDWMNGCFCVCVLHICPVCMILQDWNIFHTNSTNKETKI